MSSLCFYFGGSVFLKMKSWINHTVKLSRMILNYIKFKSREEFLCNENLEG